jgi:hypothetical protein
MSKSPKAAPVVVKSKSLDFTDLASVRKEIADASGGMLISHRHRLEEIAPLIVDQLEAIQSQFTSFKEEAAAQKTALEAEVVKYKFLFEDVAASNEQLQETIVQFRAGVAGIMQEDSSEPVERNEYLDGEEEDFPQVSPPVSVSTGEEEEEDSPSLA